MLEIEITGARLYYQVSGAGEPLLLIPGLGMDHTYYRLGVPLLSRSLQVFAVDPRGIGRSTKSTPPYTVEAWADDFAAMIDRLGLGPIHVLGSSLGGAMALAMAQRHPGKLKSLMVVGGFSELDRATELNFRLRLRLIQKLGMSDEVADYMGLWTLTRKFINSDAGFATMRANQANIRANSAELYSAFVEALLKWGRCQGGQEQEPGCQTEQRVGFPSFHDVPPQRVSEEPAESKSRCGSQIRCSSRSARKPGPRRFIFEARMWSATIVISQEGAQRSAALRRRGIGYGVCPFPQERLDKSLGFPIRPRRVGSRPPMADVERVTGRAKSARPVAASVVTQHTKDADAPSLEPGDGTREKRGAGRAELVRQDLDVGNPAVIIHRDVDVLPADARAGPTAISMNAMADAPDAPK